MNELAMEPKPDIIRNLLKTCDAHSEKAHKGKAFSETGFERGCYRCRLLLKIRKSK